MLVSLDMGKPLDEQGQLLIMNKLGRLDFEESHALLVFQTPKRKPPLAVITHNLVGLASTLEDGTPVSEELWVILEHYDGEARLLNRCVERSPFHPCRLTRLSKNPKSAVTPAMRVTQIAVESSRWVHR